MTEYDDEQFNTFDVAEPESEALARSHPKPEQLLLRQAVSYLTKRQQEIWELYNFDKKSQTEIAAILRISQQAVQKHIGACEVRITKWCRANMGTYELLKRDYSTLE